jgi:hypothetical protein
MVPPEILYKYKPNNNYTSNIIEKGELYFPSVSELNDPFEGSIPFVFDESELTFENVFLKMHSLAKEMFPEYSEADIYKHVSDNYGKGGLFDEKYLKEQTLKIKNEVETKFGIYSMTTKKDNLLMWSHYANAHKGICIGFNVKILMDTVKGILKHVCYQMDLPIYRLLGNELDFMQRLLLTKSSDWEYENEYRLLVMDVAQKTFNIPFNGIVEIIYGCKMLQPEKDELTKIILKNAPNCKIYEAWPSKMEFKLDILPK